ncbi:MAG TPA: L,D-transpeptidase [Baekduia sp.]|nr:L,D-transpeptidase [Baekduia sp.]
MTPPRPAARIAAWAAGLTAAAALGACGADVEPLATTTVAQQPPATTATVPAPAPKARRRPRLRPPLAFHVRHRALLRAKPGGKPVAVVTTHTEFKSPRIYAVAGRRHGWVKVRTAVRHHPVGWIRGSAGVLFSQPRTILIDLSRHRLTLLHHGKPAKHFEVAVGAPATPTPRGTFGVTDRLRVKPGSPYGCCVLALTAHQPKIAQGWGGGDRVAIHATPSTWTLGHDVSHGCVRATDKALRQLFRHVRLGTLVKIRR